MKNAHNLYGYEVFHLYYYGVNLFLAVGRVEEDFVYVYEVETYEIDAPNGDTYDMLKWNNKTQTFQGKALAQCLFVPEIKGTKNTHLESTFKSYPTDIEDGAISLPIEINIGDRLYNAALEVWDENDTVLPGTYFAHLVCTGSSRDIEKILKTGFKKMVIDWDDLPQA